MIKKIFLFCFIVTLLFGQEVKNKIPSFIEHNTILGVSTQTEYITFRIPFSSLLFIKEKQHYKAAFTFSVEIYKDKVFLKREIKNYTVLANNYQITNSDSQYFQNLISLELQPASYTFKYAITLENTDISIQLKEKKLEIKKLGSEKIFPPVIVNNKIINEKENIFTLTNYENSIPFSPKKYNLLIGIADTSVNEITVNITQEEKTVIEKTFKKLFTDGILLKKENEKIIVLKNNTVTNVNYFLINNFSNYLYEGKAEIKITLRNEEKIFPLKIVWFDKPLSLSNPAYAIKLLSYIEKPAVIRAMLQLDKKEYYKELFKYWENKFPSKNKKFNFAIKEYYSRADYAIKNFTSLKNNKGAQTDRGKIYILYGKPSSVKRNYNEKNETIEIWRYDKIGRVFAFKDVTGTGKFILEN